MSYLFDFSLFLGKINQIQISKDFSYCLVAFNINGVNINVLHFEKSGRKRSGCVLRKQTDRQPEEGFESLPIVTSACNIIFVFTSSDSYNLLITKILVRAE